MHDHSRFQRDINDVTGVSLSLYLSQKSLTHNIGSASALPIILEKKVMIAIIKSFETRGEGVRKLAYFQTLIKTQRKLR